LSNYFEKIGAGKLDYLISVTFLLPRSAGNYSFALPLTALSPMRQAKEQDFFLTQKVKIYL